MIVQMFWITLMFAAWLVTMGMGLEFRATEPGQFEDDTGYEMVEESEVPLVLIKQISPLQAARQVRLDTEKLLHNSIARFHSRITEMECSLAANLISNSKYIVTVPQKIEVNFDAGRGLRYLADSWAAVMLGESEPMYYNNSTRYPCDAKGRFVHLDGTVRDAQGKKIKLTKKIRAEMKMVA